MTTTTTTSLPPYGTPPWTLTRKLAGADFDETIAKATAALAAEGFGVLATMDIAKTLETKIGALIRPYTILGACNPRLALGALSVEPGVGALLPCNVVVAAEEGGVVVSAIDPSAMFAVVGNTALDAIVQDVRARLGRVVDHL